MRLALCLRLFAVRENAKSVTFELVAEYEQHLGASAWKGSTEKAVHVVHAVRLYMKK
jgi:hypothetical protein